jgi:hypothetical protein
MSPVALMLRVVNSVPLFPSETLRALLARLIPVDEFPGAVEAGTENYVYRHLAGDGVAEAPALSRGLALLDAEAHARFDGQRFSVLAPADQDSLLRELEHARPRAAWPAELPSAAFLARMIDLAHEGFYADPDNGGNRGAVSWRMIGYDPRLPPAAPKKNPLSPNESPTSPSSAGAPSRIFS